MRKKRYLEGVNPFLFIETSYWNKIVNIYSWEVRAYYTHLLLYTPLGLIIPIFSILETIAREHLCAVGAESIPVCVAGMDDQIEFCEVIIERRRKELNLDRLEKEVLSVVDVLARENPEKRALVIGCTELPPFSHLIQEKINVPIFDIHTLTKMVYQALVRKN